MNGRKLRHKIIKKNETFLYYFRIFVYVLKNYYSPNHALF
jgi:hypothetical protein